MTETETRVNGIPAGSTGATNPAGTPIANDRAINNSNSTSGGAGGGLRSSAGNLALGTRTAFTMTGWIKPGAASGLTTGFPRLMLLGWAAGYDAGAGQQGAYFAIYNNTGTSAGLQFKVNGDTSNGALSASGVLGGTDWIFVAVSYDSSLPNNQVKFYTGQRLATLTGPASSVAYGGGAAVNFGPAAHAYLLNRANLGRAFSGYGDDFRIYDRALDVATLDAVRASAVSAANLSPANQLLYQWNFNVPVSTNTARPQTGTGGVLTLRNSADAATDLHARLGMEYQELHPRSRPRSITVVSMSSAMKSRTRSTSERPICWKSRCGRPPAKFPSTTPNARATTGTSAGSIDRSIWNPVPPRILSASPSIRFTMAA